MKKDITQIIKDVVENIKGYKDRINDLGEDYYNYDRHNFIYNYYVGGDIDRENVGEDIYSSDIQTITTELIQMYLRGQILYEDRDGDGMIDRFKGMKKMNINEDLMIDDKKVIESFVWYCFGKLKEETIQNFIISYREDMTEYYRNSLSKVHNVDSTDDDMNTHHKQTIEKDLENQKERLDTTLLQFTDRLGFSKDSWKKMLGL